MPIICGRIYHRSCCKFPLVRFGSNKERCWCEGGVGGLLSRGRTCVFLSSTYRCAISCEREGECCILRRLREEGSLGVPAQIKQTSAHYGSGTKALRMDFNPVETNREQGSAFFLLSSSELGGTWPAIQEGKVAPFDMERACLACLPTVFLRRAKPNPESFPKSCCIFSSPPLLWEPASTEKLQCPSPLGSLCCCLHCG